VVGGAAPGVGARAFHEKTRFPLVGAHARVACAACHGPAGREGARFRGLAFARCTDCHLDAHLGQMSTPARAGDGRTCDRCHGLEAFLPVTFEAEDHAATGFELEGAHRAVACSRCHVSDPGLAARIPAKARAELERKKRPVRVSLARFAPVKAGDCKACHRDPHAGQFDRRGRPEGCTACHVSSSFRELRFDHARDTSFPLEGKHAGVACGSCHRPDASGVVRYAPRSHACAACHSDPHAGQFSTGGAAGTDCARCHGTAGWKETRFVHAAPFTGFELTGKHRGLDCARCHPAVQVAGATVRKYRPLPTRCAGCHEDVHRGAFRGFVP